MSPGDHMETAIQAAELALLRMSLTAALARALADDPEVLSINVSARQGQAGEVDCDVELCGQAGFPVGGFSL
jgi:hypothetical protein